MRLLITTLTLLLAGCSGSARFPVPDYRPEAYVRVPDASGNLAVAAPRLAVRRPPPQYDHPYHGRTKEHYVPLVTARSMCAGHDACDWIARDGTCHIVVPYAGQAPVHDRGAYQRWETAGCNGQPDQIIVLRRRR